MKSQNVLIPCLLFMLLRVTLTAQSTNLARLEYAYIPQAKSDNVYSRIRFLGNYPIKLKKEGSYLIIGIGYRFNNLDLQDDIPLESRGNLGEFHTLGLRLGYTFLMKKDWRFVAETGLRISSNFETSDIISDDFRYSGTVFFLKNFKKTSDLKTSRLILGLRFSTPSSITFPLPILNYTRKFHPNWSYSLGTPKTNIKYFHGKKHTLQAFVGLDRFYGNIQRNMVYIDENGTEKTVANASMLVINSALGYEYFFTEHILFFGYAGYTLSNEIRLRNEKQENVLNINDQNTIYLRTGIKLKI